MQVGRYLKLLPRVMAEESLEAVQNGRGLYKERIRQLVERSTGDEDLAQKIWAKMSVDEMLERTADGGQP